ncbi:hypothetical protein [Bradyrhizobium sp. WYCCWR 12699]|uniref:hypothetical protein n=1 Tax=Bradyrhizobium sp. WYCCWR 12699 TaxID=3064203 RepID=UPI0028A36E81|nr:hypothetical protein [Bradyrhizobium sp. WYCCWR 12699]MDT4737067.1 hypothetical protein [Bradyrhizobium sp. WYCCWR 12699]
MPISRLMANIDLTPEQKHVLELAFNHALRKLDLVDRDDPICDLIAKRMIDISMRGVTDAVALAEITVREIKQPALKNHEPQSSPIAEKGRISATPAGKMSSG